MRAILVLALAGLLAIALGWWAWNAHEPPFAPPAAAPTVSQAPADTATAPLHAPTSEPQTADPASANQRTAADAGTTPGPGPLVPVRVVDAEQGSPVAGAEVFWAKPGVWQELAGWPAAQRRAMLDDPELLARRIGRSTRSGADGLVHVDCGGQALTLFAYADGRHGQAWVTPFAPPRDGWTVRLEVDRTLRVRVLGADGAPRGAVPVLVRAELSSGELLDPLQGKSVCTEADGCAELRHTQNWLRQGQPPPRAEVATWRVLLGVPGHRDPGVAFAVDAPPAEPIELHLPAIGSVVASVVHQGVRWQHEVQFTARAKADSTAVPAPPPVLPGPDGLAQLPVACGGELVVTVEFPTARCHETVMAPRRDGEQVQVQFTTERLFALTGLLVGPDGALLANHSVTADFEVGAAMGGRQLQTDERGRFVWFFGSGRSQKLALRRLQFTWHASHGSPVRAVVAPRDLGLGVTDLGVLRLGPEDLVVAGRVLVDGAPRSGPWHLAVEVLPTAPPPGTPDGFVPMPELMRGHFDDGRFEIRGTVPPGRCRLVFSGNDIQPMAPIEFVPGARDVEVSAALGHRLTALALVPAATPRKDLVARLRPKFALPTEASAWSGLPDRLVARSGDCTGEEWPLHWSGLPAGSYDLEVGIAGFPAPVAVLAEVVLPLAANGDPRLTAIDLRSAVAAVRFEVSFEGLLAGAAMPSSVVVFPELQADANEWRGCEVPVGGVMAAPAAGGQVMVCCPPFAPVRVALAGERVVVTLGLWPVTEIRCVGLPALPEGFEAVLSVQGLDTGLGERYYQAGGSHGGLLQLVAPPQQSVVLRDGLAQLRLGEGEQRLTLYLRAPRRGGGAGGAGRGDRERYAYEQVRTLDPESVRGGGSGEVVVQVVPGEVAAAVARLLAAK
jgi:hypothetical protein